MELLEELNDGMEWVFRYYWRYLNQAKDPVPPRDDVMWCDVQTNTKESDNNLKLQGFSSDLQEKVKEVVTEYWDVFFEDGFHRPFRGFSFQIDTGNHTPICCKPPRYGPRESNCMQNLLKRMDENGVVEEDNGPWGSLVVLAAKTHKENFSWH